MDTPLSPIPVLYQDESLLAIDKPAGLPTLPDGYDPTAPHLRSLLEPHFGRLWIVHRLDRDTSGVLLLARTAEAHRFLNTQFDQRQASKVYHALVVGNPEWSMKTVDLPLRVDVGHKHRTAVDPRRGKLAITDLRVLERFITEWFPSAYALIKAVPKTGRTHQIRAHLAALGYPLLADALYGESQLEPHTLMPRLALHALQLNIEHPVSHTTLHIKAPYPEDFNRALAQLRQLK
jgi:tRNA pseudouridine32 synthase/23S rRNA pseudouridine746 synthase